MRFSLTGLAPELEREVASALVEAGHAQGKPAELAVVAVEPAVGDDLVELDHAGWAAAVAATRSAFFAVQGAARAMVDGGLAGSIVVVVPAHALRTSRGCGLAAVAGSFLMTTAEVAAVELGARGIRVNVVALGPLDGQAPAQAAAAVPLGRLARASDLAGACVLLAAPEAAFVTGAVIAVDGGYHVTKATGGSPFAER